MRIRSSRQAFTLIEMLVVIAVIGILAGIIFRMMVTASQAALRARTMGRLEQVANALNEYRAEYGQYPPVRAEVIPKRSHEEEDFDRYEGPDGMQLFKYEFESAGSSGASQHQADYLRNNYFTQPGDWPGDVDDPDEPYLFRKGLLSFLLPRDPDDWQKDIMWSDPPGYDFEIIHTNHDPQDFPDREHRWIGDTQRDLHAKQRWAHFLRDIVSVGHYEYPRKALGNAYLQAYARIHDSWDRSLLYESRPPYQSYRLWSSGPDRKTNPDDPDDPVNDDDIEVGIMDR